ncbi:hypothetical protein [Arthrobacter sp. P2b]|jgi:hypothetical protein|uniref:hypothetical protein n=1 Tax=Arthrobacter sp. P2b TaxID=1938741 RepID=UPI0009A81902|nr:hypothetical protein [Arthrobacter sp. P2b]SLK11866.1 hypothetical protein SAMN06272721_11596 [Arthrobacter sp. P2b]
MDRALNAIVNLDVPADTVWIDVRGSLNHESRPDLMHIIRRVRRMGIRSHVRVDLSNAVLVESSALAGLRTDLNAMDSTLPALHGAGVSLHLTPATDSWTSPSDTGESRVQPLVIVDDDVALLGAGHDAFPAAPAEPLEEIFGRPLAEYADEELLAASDSLFAMLDNPKAFAGADLLGRYNDIGQELSRRRQEPETPFPAAEDQAAS